MAIEVEFDAVERARQRRRSTASSPKPLALDRTGEDQNQPGRAVFQIVERLRIGGRRIGMVDPLHQRPGRARRAAGHGARGGRAFIKRFDGQAVIGPADQPLERRALKHGVNELAPVVLRCRGKIAGK